MIMKISTALLSLSLVATLVPGAVALKPHAANAQTLVNAGPASDTTWRPIKIMVARFLVDDFREDGINMGSDAQIEVSPLMMSGDWLLATWYIVSSTNPNGWAGQLLFKKQANGWVYVGGGNYIQDTQTLMDFGVPRSNAESLEDGPDI